jgi:hypothetical protein
MAAAMNEMAILTPVLRRSIEDAVRRIDDAARVGAYPRYRPRYDPDYEQDYDRDHDRDGDRDYDRDQDRDRDED